MSASAVSHAPVLLNEMLSALQPKDGETYVDGTFGAGGYSEAILRAASCRVFAIDRDPLAAAHAQKLCQEFGERFVFIAGNFADVLELLHARGVQAVNGIVLDLGVSSMQLDEAWRGFSFRNDGPLDMRMSQHGITAADAVNNLPEKELARIIEWYGEERGARRIAKAIVESRQQKPITRTEELAQIIRRVVQKEGRLDPATRTFQALRIHVNGELDAIERVLPQAEELLLPKGRLVVVAFHSLEDRLVKKFLLSRCGDTRGVSRYLPDPADAGAAGDGRKENGRTLPTFFLPRRGTVSAGNEEMERNPRARSARLRSAVRTEAVVGAPA